MLRNLGESTHVAASKRSTPERTSHISVAACSERTIRARCIDDSPATVTSHSIFFSDCHALNFSGRRRQDACTRNLNNGRFRFLLNKSLSLTTLTLTVILIVECCRLLPQIYDTGLGYLVEPILENAPSLWDPH